MPRHNNNRLVEAVLGNSFVSIQWSVDRRRMKRPLRLVLWLFLLLVQQKITVAIPLRNAADPHHEWCGWRGTGFPIDLLPVQRASRRVRRISRRRSEHQRCRAARATPKQLTRSN